MAERFFAPALGPDNLVRLTGEEAHHLARVRRIRRGERVQVFDGTGMQCEAVVREITRSDVLLALESRQHVDRELPFPLTLACAPPKGDRLRWLIEKSTELGVTRLVPIVTERSSDQAKALRVEKTERWVIEACKQCGRNVLMEITNPVRWGEFLHVSSPAHRIRRLALPTGRPLDAIDAASASGGVVIAVGPEGGLEDAELALAYHLGWEPVTLGPRILRIETAALAAVASTLALMRFEI